MRIQLSSPARGRCRGANTALIGYVISVGILMSLQCLFFSCGRRRGPQIPTVLRIMSHIALFSGFSNSRYRGMQRLPHCYVHSERRCLFVLLRSHSRSWLNFDYVLWSGGDRLRMGSATVSWSWPAPSQSGQRWLGTDIAQPAMSGRRRECRPCGRRCKPVLAGVEDRRHCASDLPGSGASRPHLRLLWLRRPSQVRL